MGIGDSVRVIGKLYNYNGTIEISGGNVELIEKSVVEIVAIEVSVTEAVAVVSALEPNAKTDEVYAVTGYVDSIAVAYSEQYHNISFFMTDDMANPAYNFQAFRVKTTAEDAEKIVLGAKVKVTAQLQYFHQDAVEATEDNPGKPAVDLAETVAGGEIEFLGESAVENILSEQNATKRLENGQIVIYRNGACFTATGTQIR